MNQKTIMLSRSQVKKKGVDIVQFHLHYRCKSIHSDKQPGGNGGAGRGDPTKGREETLGVMDMTTILILVMVSWLCTYVKTYQILYIKYNAYNSIKLFKNYGLNK